MVIGVMPEAVVSWQKQRSLEAISQIHLEVKAGSTGSLKSLHYFMHVKGLKQAVRTHADHPSAVVVDTKIHIYLIGQLHR